MANPDESNSVTETRANEYQDSCKITLTLDEIEQALEEFSTNRWNSKCWEDMKQRYGQRGVVGEICAPEDWRNFPRGVPARVVFLHGSNGPLLRWSIEDKQLSKEIEAVTNERNRAMLEGDNFRKERLERRLKELHKAIITHEHLATYKPTTDSGLRTGYITFKANNELVVNAKKGKYVFPLDFKKK